MRLVIFESYNLFLYIIDPAIDNVIGLYLEMFVSSL